MGECYSFIAIRELAAEVRAALYCELDPNTINQSKSDMSRLSHCSSISMHQARDTHRSQQRMSVNIEFPHLLVYECNININNSTTSVSRRHHYKEFHKLDSTIK